MIPLVDYHMHTPLCGHAEGEPSAYAQKAIELGLKEIGFSDHAPMVHRPLPGITMSEDELPQYYTMMENVRKEFNNGLTIKVGIEADFIPGYEEKTRKILDAYAYDYVIGSVHFIGDWDFDNPDEREKWDEEDVNSVYQAYFQLLRDSANSGLFDIMAHTDLVKKFGHRPTVDLKEEWEKTAEVFKAASVAIEINTAGLRKPVGEIYPSLAQLKVFARHKIPLTFGSDAHKPEEVGWAFDKAAELAKAAGYSEYVSFKGRKIEKTFGL